MGIRTGQRFRDKLDAMNPHLVIDGEVVSKNLMQHPAFKNLAPTYAKLFDMQHDPAYQDALTCTSPTTGQKVNASFPLPRTKEDPAQRRAATNTWAQYSNGILGRTADHRNWALTALAGAKTCFAQADPVCGERIEAYCRFARETTCWPPAR